MDAVCCYNFLGLLPVQESLSSRGARLHDTQAQRIKPTYAPDVHLKVNVSGSRHKLFINFVDDRRLVLSKGERVDMRLWFSNAGESTLDEVWMIASPDDELWMESVADDLDRVSRVSDDVLESSNSLAPQRPVRIRFDKSQSLQPGESASISVVLHADTLGPQDLRLLFVYRDSTVDKAFHSLRVTRSYEVRPSFDVFLGTKPSQSLDHLYHLDLQLRNSSPAVAFRVNQVLMLSPTWEIFPLKPLPSFVPPLQAGNMGLGARPWHGGSGVQETYDFVSRNLRCVVQGIPPVAASPPPISVLCGRSDTTGSSSWLHESEMIRRFLHSGRRKASANLVTSSYPHIKDATTVFPLYNPRAVDLVLFWETEDLKHSGHLYVSGVNMGAGHGALQDILEASETGKSKRSMYAETRREQQELLESLRTSEWNVEMNPVVVALPDNVVVTHDLGASPCRVPVTFTLRNHSQTHPSRYLLNLTSKTEGEVSSSSTPPSYAGRSTFRGTIPPSEQVSILANLWVTRQGTYSLSGWRLETEVLEPAAARARQRYIQKGLPTSSPQVTVLDKSRLHPSEL
ncbi:hypothetical protein ONZ45_g14623 [Pleurotus djamor]|nr:hypothetical protein ONZ45_g14623 [Pleurotus djamor]